MSTGDDYAWQHPSIAALQAAKVEFVCRYLSRDPAKNLTRAEADQLHAAGIATVSNWEAASGAAAAGRGQGVTDAKDAAPLHTACGGPADRPIYFSADWNVQPGELVTVGAYFQGVASVIGLPRTGAYGGIRVIRYLLDHGLITWAWQTYAWSGGLWDPRAHIRQVRNGVVLGGADTDLDQGMVADVGQWPLVGGTDVTPEEHSKLDAVYNLYDTVQLDPHLPPFQVPLTKVVKGIASDLAVVKTAVVAPARVTLSDDQLAQVVAAVTSTLTGIVPTVEEIDAAVDKAVKARLDGATVHTAGN
jgi:hypothetical protein